jgi:hypothetical protein
LGQKAVSEYELFIKGTHKENNSGRLGVRAMFKEICI